MKPSTILITGAAGALGRALRERLQGRYGLMRLSDRAAMVPPGPGEETVVAELTDVAAVARICQGVEAIVHLGGQSVEGTWDQVIQANLIGAINLYEGARQAGVDRVLFATSNHAIGFYRRTQRIDHTAPPRPDSRYGLSKAFGEDLSQYYALKHGIRGFCMRIGSCTEPPVNERMLSTWQSYDDFSRLVTVGLEADYTYEIVYGVSRNTRSTWDNSNAYRLGYNPKDNAETFASELEGKIQPDPLDEVLQGGQYISPDYTGKPDWIA
jgi:uronate dehydrogenase